MSLLPLGASLSSPVQVEVLMLSLGYGGGGTIPQLTTGKGFVNVGNGPEGRLFNVLW